MLKVTSADIKEVDRLCKLLCDTYDQFVKDNPGFAPINAFMAAHNFHKIVVLRQAEHADSNLEKDLLCQMAADTFKLSMEKQVLYKRDNN